MNVKIESFIGRELERVSTLLDSERDSHIHFIGVAGTGMGSLAGLFSDANFKVSGSDMNIYPPMSDLLREKGIEFREGWKRENLEPAPSLVIIGNAISRTNLEVEVVLDRKIPFTSFPSALFQAFMKERRRIVVAGTHGKTTCTSLLAWVMERAGRSPSFLVGGIPQNFRVSSMLGNGRYFIVEGDEYDTSFFDKGSKFLHFKPDLLLLTGIEYDHADIFPDFKSYREAFDSLVRGMNEGSVVVTHKGKGGESLGLRQGVRLITYGEEGSDFRVQILNEGERGMEFSLILPGDVVERFFIPLHGEFNAMNAAGCAIILLEAGLTPDEIREGFSTFLGVKRRAEMLYNGMHYKVILDFAHHPTAVHLTLKGLKKAYKDDRLVAIFEPRTQTSRRRIFQKEYVRAFEFADSVICAPPFSPEKIPIEDRFSPEEMIDDLKRSGKDAHYIGEISEILRFVCKKIKKGSLIVIMSSGSFSGLPSLLVENIKGIDQA